MTSLPSISLGQDAYARELSAHGLTLVGNDEDEGLLLLRDQAVTFSAPSRRSAAPQLRVAAGPEAKM